MKYEDMQLGIQYIVTDQGNGLLFKIGDKIEIETVRKIMFHRQNFFKENINGMECNPDMEWLESHIANLEKQVEYFKKIYEEYEELIEL